MGGKIQNQARAATHRSGRRAMSEWAFTLGPGGRAGLGVEPQGKKSKKVDCQQTPKFAPTNLANLEQRNKSLHAKGAVARPSLLPGPVSLGRFPAAIFHKNQQREERKKRPSEKWGICLKGFVSCEHSGMNSRDDAEVRVRPGSFV